MTDIDLNPEQQAVVQHHYGPMRVASVAGSGKTAAIIERVAYLIQKRHVSPTDILMISFSRIAATEMKRRINKRLPSLGADKCVRTFHSLGLMIFKQEIDDHNEMEIDNTGLLYIKAGAEAYRSMGVEPERKALKKFASSVKNDLIGTNETLRRLGRIDPRMARIAENACSDAAVDAATVIEAFYKTEEIRAKTGVEHQGVRKRFVTFDDMIYETALVLKQGAVRARWAKRWQFVLQDEAQDVCASQDAIAEALCRDHKNYMVVGDSAQCVAGHTMVSTPGGPVPIKAIREGDKVTAFSRSTNLPRKVSAIQATGPLDCVTITTSGGHALTMSLNHKIWATPPIIRTSGELLVYLMYRNGFGFRAGITNHGIQGTRWGNRMTGESADKLWIMEYASDREDALLKEARLSLSFGIPTAVFNAKNRGINQDRIDALFSEFGSRGFSALETYGFLFDFPHWTSSSRYVGSTQRRVVRVVSHAKKGTQVSLEWTGRTIDTTGLDTNIHPAKKGGSRIRKFFTSHAPAEAFAATLAVRADAYLVNTLSQPQHKQNEKLLLITAGALHVGMQVPVEAGDRYALERIDRIERSKEDCFDITVEDSGTFYGNGILSHNSIFAFRGAKPEKLLAFDKEWPSAKTIVMHRNYRSGVAIVDLANCIMGCMPADTVVTDDMGIATDMVSERNTQSYIGYHEFDSPREEASAVAKNIQSHHDDEIKWSDQAVLLRMNYMTRDIELALANRAIPYKLVSGQSFFTLHEAKVVFGYLRVLAGRGTGNDIQQALMNPSRKLGKVFVKSIIDARVEDEDWFDAVERVRLQAKPYQARAVLEWLIVMRDERNSVRKGDFGDFVTRFFGRLGLEDELRRQAGDQEDSKALQNLDEVLAFARRYADVDQLLDTLDRIEKHRAANARKRDAVTVSTVHKMKGAERKVIYVIQVADGLFPAARADVAEERRIFYVAVTRAMDELWISYSIHADNHAEVDESPLLIESGLLLSLGEYRYGRAIEPLPVGSQIGLSL